MTEDNSKRNYGFLLIDMQKQFLENIEHDELERIISGQGIILSYCAQHDLPVVLVEYEGEGSTIEPLKELSQKVHRKATVIKSHDNGFRNTELSDILRRWGLSDVCLMGVNASGCVRATASHALKNFRIATAGNLIADPNYWNATHPDDEKSKKWYFQHGVYYQNHIDLLIHGQLKGWFGREEAKIEIPQRNLSFNPVLQFEQEYLPFLD
ncbi:isochorismatase family protein [Candidatus Woesearchaeota archaeon]|nr:isochorismatase family protein [Candidatus Woesearchaeota archaeon]